MDIDTLISLLSFAFIASFTPGPNNIFVMSHAINKGYQSTIPYQIGAGLACFVIIGLCILLGVELEKIIPLITPIMKYFGCAYMIYLAFIVFTSKPAVEQEKKQNASILTGLILQFINPKFYLYALTLAAIVIPLTNDFFKISFYSFLFSIIAIAGMSTWAISGALLQKFLQRWYRITNIIMSIALIWCAITLLVSV